MVIGQRNTPVLPSAHNNIALSTGTQSNGAAQPDAGATDTTRVRSDGFNDEASQHNNGADFDVDPNCAPPIHLPLEAARLTKPDEEFTHNGIAIPASATPPDHKALANTTTAIPARLKRFITLSCPEVTGHGGVRGMPQRLPSGFAN